MTKKTICLGIAMLGLWSAPTVFAQGAIMDNPQFQAAREMVQASQEAIIREDLRLTASEEAAFWPLYEEYRADTLPIRDRYIGQIADYMRQYETGILTNEYAEGMIDGYFEVREDLLRVRKNYVKRFADILPMLKVARFYQLENKMTADVEAELALLVPLVEAY